MKLNPELDLVFERTSKFSPKKLWQAWTQPNTLMKWFCPKPWAVTECRIDLRPGGEFYTLMQGPAGEKMPNNGCYLEVVENQKLIWTNCFSQGFRPNLIQNPGFPMAVTVTLTALGSGTLYKAVVAHADVASRKQHEQMGFQEGWGLAFKQLEELL